LEGRDGLQAWKVAANILKKQSGHSTRGDSLVWGLGKGLTTHHCKKSARYKMLHRTSDLVPVERLRERKMDMRLGTRNVRGLYRAVSLKIVARELVN
jgi:hypothetical protein